MSIKHFGTQHQREVAFGKFNNNEVFKLHKLVNDGNIRLQKVAVVDDKNLTKSRNSKEFPNRLKI